jgi:arabinose-5-phosphate isomerase
MHPITPVDELPVSHEYERSSTMALDMYPRNSHVSGQRIPSLACRTPGATDYFGINPALTPPESVCPDDAKSDAPDSDVDSDFTVGTSEAIVKRAREILDTEAQNISTLSALLAMETFIPFIRIMHQCRGHIILTGIGKSGLIAQKISATLASTGRPSFFLHSAEALHGDMGRITRRDVVVALSNSGEGPELTHIAKAMKESTFTIDETTSDDEYFDSPFCGAKFLLITGNPNSSLSRYADAILSIGDMKEACAFNVVPTNTTTAMLALGDALALCLFELLSGRRYSLKTFANFHPGGSLGKKLVRVQHAMKPCGSFVQMTDTLREAIEILETNATGRYSAVVIVDSSYRFIRLFTDRDLRQLLLIRFPDGGSLSLDSAIGQCIPFLAQSQHQSCIINQKMLVGDAHRMMKTGGMEVAVVTDERFFPIGILNM